MYCTKEQTTLNIIPKPQKRASSAAVRLRGRGGKTKRTMIADIRKTHYKLIREVMQTTLHWKILKANSCQTANLIWSDWYVSADEVQSLGPNQKINHFPGSYQLGNKHFLTKNINRLKKKYPEEFKFFPDTWLVPKDFEIFRQQTEGSRAGTWIMKPASSCQGKGIIVTNDIERIWQKIKGSRKQYVLQTYIRNPYLLSGLKFDFRLYVLVTSLKPLQVYIYKEGLARLATAHYKQPHKSNTSNSFMHLTNYAVNKKNSTFCNEEQGHKRKFSSVLESLSKEGKNITLLMESISKAVVSTIISAQPYLSHLYASSAPERAGSKNCFQLFGFDIILNQDFQASIMEVNHTPSFQASSPIDQEIKSNLIADTLRVVTGDYESRQLKEGSFEWSLTDNYSYKQICPLEQFSQYHGRLLEHAQLLFDVWTGVVKKPNTTAGSSQITLPKKPCKIKSLGFFQSRTIGGESAESPDITKRMSVNNQASLKTEQSSKMLIPSNPKKERRYRYAPRVITSLNMTEVSPSRDQDTEKRPCLLVNIKSVGDDPNSGWIVNSLRGCKRLNPNRIIRKNINTNRRVSALVQRSQRL